MELKFRAWDNDLKYMFTIGDMPDLLIGFDGHIYNNGFPFTSQIKCISSSITLMQFTGLTDKNGVEIFEGDIVHCQTGEDAFIEQQGTIVAELSYNGLLPLVCSETQEVIGNIHQHPELMEPDHE